MVKAQSKQQSDQLNVRSRFARARAAQIAMTTGMSITQVVEDALRAYQPTVRRAGRPGLIQKGRLLVLSKGGRKISNDQVEAQLDEIRGGTRE